MRESQLRFSLPQQELIIQRHYENEQYKSPSEPNPRCAWPRRLPCTQLVIARLTSGIHRSPMRQVGSLNVSAKARTACDALGQVGLAVARAIVHGSRFHEASPPPTGRAGLVRDSTIPLRQVDHFERHAQWSSGERAALVSADGQHVLDLARRDRIARGGLVDFRHVALGRGLCVDEGAVVGQQQYADGVMVEATDRLHVAPGKLLGQQGPHAEVVVGLAQAFDIGRLVQGDVAVLAVEPVVVEPGHQHKIAGVDAVAR